MPDLLATVWFRITLTLVVSTAAAVTFVATNIARDNHSRSSLAIALTGGDPGNAPPIFRRYGCSGCHTIPGIPGADGQVGAPLTEYSKRVYIAGMLENRSDNLVAWIVSPQSFSHQTAMPDTGVSKQEARDVAAYLYAR